MHNTSQFRYFAQRVDEAGSNDKDKTVRRVLPYVDLPMFIDTMPDQNRACWFFVQMVAAPIGSSIAHTIERQFDITENDAQRLISALQEYLDNLAAGRLQEDEEDDE